MGLIPGPGTQDPLQPGLISTTPPPPQGSHRQGQAFSEHRHPQIPQLGKPAAPHLCLGMSHCSLPKAMFRLPSLSTFHLSSLSRVPPLGGGGEALPATPPPHSSQGLRSPTTEPEPLSNAGTHSGGPGAPRPKPGGLWGRGAAPGRLTVWPRGLGVAREVGTNLAGQGTSEVLFPPLWGPRGQCRGGRPRRQSLWNRGGAGALPHPGIEPRSPAL